MPTPTMTRKFSTLLLITLILTLPLRAVAGMTMAGCAGHDLAAEHMQAMAQQSMDACHSSAGHDDQAGHGHCHDADTPIKHVGGTCSACGDCCVGVLSIPSVEFSLFNPGSPSVQISFLAQPYAGFQPEGLDRPPRHTVL